MANFEINRGEMRNVWMLDEVLVKVLGNNLAVVHIFSSGLRASPMSGILNLTKGRPTLGSFGGATTLHAVFGKATGVDMNKAQDVA